MINATFTNDGTVEGSKQALVMDLKNAIGDAGNLVNNAAAATADEFAQARSKLEARLGQAKTRLLDASLAVSDKAKCTADATDRFVRDNPWKVLGVAAAAGLVIGAILSRR
ncbi:MAG TPA: DUF883 domain-containing protein [Azonexus sp.]|nr:DUF883 domain-containing protein [Azonexus sp.]